MNDAMISDKHCNFIVNFNNASFDDVIYLVNFIQISVKKSLNIDLEKEIIIVHIINIYQILLKT